MEETYVSIKEIEQNLKDAGCSKDTINEFIELYESGDVNKQLRTLSCHRCNLLKDLHKKQSKIDCLDYLIYKIKKSKE